MIIDSIYRVFIDGSPKEGEDLLEKQGLGIRRKECAWSESSRGADYFWLIDTWAGVSLAPMLSPLPPILLLFLQTSKFKKMLNSPWCFYSITRYGFLTSQMEVGGS